MNKKDMRIKELLIRYLIYLTKKLEYQKNINKAFFDNIKISKKYVSFDIDILENNNNYQSLHIDLLRGHVINSNKLIKNILLSL